ncbi:MAG: YceD family protein [Parachlamydiaceae bacterium]
MTKHSQPDAFKIFVEQLRSGNVEHLNEELSPDFLDVKEKELSFEDPVFLRGEAYLAESELILHFDLSTFASMPCSICNENVKVPIKVHNVYHHEPLSAIKSGVFSMREVLREVTLLEVPSFTECNHGNCAKRDELKKYLRKPQAANSDDSGYRPFENL